jgi:predicted O-methyltransferase YrrM
MSSSQRLWNLMSRLGLGRRGFVTPYAYLASSPWDVPDYPEVRALFDACRPAFAAFLADIRAQDARFAGFDRGTPRPDWQTGYLTPLDGAAIYTAVARWRPARIIEVGSGNSTRFMARAAADHATGTAITCIDPAPRVGIADLGVTLNRRVLSVADVPLAETLAANDILFIDGSHLLQQGFDLDILFNRMFPRLASGVIVHVHDIYLPYPYPPEWEGARWNEQTALIGWLLSGAFRPELSTHFAVRDMATEMAGLCPSVQGMAGSGGGSLWLRRA